MKKQTLIASLAVGVCAFGIACIALSAGITRATAVEGTSVQVAQEATLADFTEQPGEEGFVSLERMRAQVRELMKEDPALGLSSNPYDYISDGINPYFNDIVALGPAAIPDLMRELTESDRNGLEEYLFAIAIEKAEGADLTLLVDRKSLPWSGKEFLEVWESVEKEAPQRIGEIAESTELSFDEKTASLGAYGALAVPYFMELVGDEGIDPELRAFMSDYIEQWGLTDEEVAALQATPASDATFSYVTDKARSASIETTSAEELISLDRMRKQTSALMKVDERLKVTNNPYDFIEGGINPYYNEIVALGPDAIPELKRELAESPSNGLEEYLFAIAIEEILNSQGESAFDGDARPSSGKEYLEFLEDDSK